MGPPIATAEEIKTYMNEVIQENKIDEKIKYSTRVEKAEWDSGKNVWTVTARNSKTGADLVMTCNFLWMCQVSVDCDGGGLRCGGVCVL